MRKAVWESLLDAEMNVKYWRRMTQKYLKKDKTLKIFVATTASGSAVASLSIWSSYPLVWQIIVFVAAVCAVAMPILNYQKTIESVSELSGKWAEIRNDYEQQWLDIRHDKNIEYIKEKHQATKKKEVLLTPQEAGVPEDKNLLKECFENVKKQYY